MGVALIPRGKTKKFCIIITPSGYFARLYQFLAREPPSLPVFDTKLVGSFFTPSGQKAPVARGFSGDFAESYDSGSASLYQKSGADGESSCLRWSILPRLSISPNCVDTIWRNVFSRNRFRISPNRLHLCLLPDIHAVPEGEYHAAVDECADALRYVRHFVAQADGFFEVGRILQARLPLFCVLEDENPVRQQYIVNGMRKTTLVREVRQNERTRQ